MTRTPAREPRRRFALAATAVVILAAAGVGGAWAIAHAAVPPELAQARPVESLSIPYEQFDDARTVDLTATLQPSPGVVARAPGVLTRSACSPGAALRSGQAAFLVDRLPLVALSTAQPLTRPLAAGDRGADVREVQQAFAALGFTGGVDGVVGAQTIRFYNDLRRAAVADAPLVETIDPASLVWLPSAEVVVVDCPTAVGEDIEPGTVLAALPPTLLTLRVGTTPAALPDAARTLTVDGVTAAVDSSGAVDAAAWGALMATATFRSYALAPDDVVLSGTLRLGESIRVARVPPSFLRDTDDGRVCVEDGGTVFVGDLVSTDLGSTLVRFDDEPSTADAPGADTSGEPCA